jgi:formate dehydrogenase subunit delta
MSTAEDEKLDHMAGQIADFFHPYTDAEAIAGIHEHLMAFWTSGMRATLLHRIETGAATVSPRIAQALRGEVPTEHLGPVASPIRKQAAGPDALGDLAADSG